MNKGKEEAIKKFDPNSPGLTGKLFGLPFEPENAEVVILSVPWEVTCSYGTGTSRGPEAILQASSQVDLFVNEIPDAWMLGTSLDNNKHDLSALNSKLRKLAEDHLKWLQGESHRKIEENVLESINTGCAEMVFNIYERAKSYHALKKVVGLIGGDHSTCLGLIQALSEKYGAFGILQIDAHADLRDSYEGFTFSHASIMYNALKNDSIKKLVQVGIRDLCEEEVEFIESSNARVITFYDEQLKEERFKGTQYHSQVKRIISELPEKVYISFDIDGLDPSLCPNTGTPVPGGLSFEEAQYLIRELVRSGREIIGFDLCEVSPDADHSNDWDANVGARILYYLINYTGLSHGLLSERPE